MEKSKHFVFGISVALAFAILVYAQDQSGFISIDCGISKDSSYTDLITGIKYISDANFTETGISKSISTQFNAIPLPQQFRYVRSFPEGIRNCYIIKPSKAKGNKYLIRASFMYGNYDEQDKVPHFDLYIGVKKWDSVKPDNASSVLFKEVVHVESTSSINVCLVNTGNGTPFISALELRALDNITYRTDFESLALYQRFDVGSSTNVPVRFKDDNYDRIWMPFSFDNSKSVNTSSAIDSGAQYVYQLPGIVMGTAMTPGNASTPLNFTWVPENPKAKYHVYLHLAEIEKLEGNQSRQFNIFQNEKYIYGPFTPQYLYSTTLFTISPVSGKRIEFSLIKTDNSTLPPTVNAFEVYMALDASQSQTDEQDIKALMNIKSLYGVRKNWQGDPCAPQTFLWDGLNCSYDGQDPYRITILNLSSSGLTGNISTYISDLQFIEYLDLSNNSLTGPVPDFISKMPSLRGLDLRENNLSGSVSDELIKRSKNGSLSLRFEGNPNLCTLDSCQMKKKSKGYTVAIVVSVLSVFILLTAAILWILKRNKQAYAGSSRKTTTIRLGSIDKKQKFKFSEVEKMTNNFENKIGKGGFGDVYHGYLSTGEVAVKVLSDDAVQGNKEYLSEVELSLSVHHRNLTNLVGYCNEGNKRVLIYEYMANGDLKTNLSERKAIILSWEDRMRIAVGVAQGLEYLHHGCKPPVVHRDVKSANILLNENFEAKIADFGLCRTSSTENGTRFATTAVAGTPGYVDPEYYVSWLLTMKSDVYSFGVVLLEIITCRPIVQLSDSKERIHISDWVTKMLEKGDIKSVVDPRLEREFETNSAWKAVEIAMNCLLHDSTTRPAMNQVVTELNDCLALEIARKRSCDDAEIRHSNMIGRNLRDTEISPLSR